MIGLLCNTFGLCLFLCGTTSFYVQPLPPDPLRTPAVPTEDHWSSPASAPQDQRTVPGPRAAVAHFSSGGSTSGRADGPGPTGGSRPRRSGGSALRSGALRLPRTLRRQPQLHKRVQAFSEWHASSKAIFSKEQEDHSKSLAASSEQQAARTSNKCMREDTNNM